MGVYSVYTFAIDIVITCSITVVLEMQYCVIYFCKVQ